MKNVKNWCIEHLCCKENNLIALKMRGDPPWAPFGSPIPSLNTADPFEASGTPWETLGPSRTQRTPTDLHRPLQASI